MSDLPTFAGEFDAADITPTRVVRRVQSGIPLAQPVDEIPGYELLSKLGQGGMGVVWKAKQLALNRIVALKMVRSGTHDEAELLARFRIEAVAIAQLRHPNIVQIFEVGEYRDPNVQPFFAMELIEGGSLGAYLAGKPRPVQEAASIVEALARGMDHAHENGILHRDLKPVNVLLDRDGTPKITDFGLAKQLNSGDGRTETGLIMGTPAYMSPEQASGAREIGPHADIYSLGVILYECLTGSLPFQCDSFVDLVILIGKHEPLPPSRLVASIPSDLEAICLKCLEKQPHRRYASAGALADDLRRFLDGRPTLARPLGRIGHLWKWTRRNPWAALLMLVSTLGSAIIITMLTVGLFILDQRWRETEGAKFELSKSNLELQSEQKKTLAALDREHEISYRQNVMLADSARRENQLARARDFLKASIPEAEQTDLRRWEWHYLWKQTDTPSDLVLAGHPQSAMVMCLTFSYDDQLLASSGVELDPHVILWDVKTGKCLQRIPLSDNLMANRLEFNPKLPMLAVARKNGFVWDIEQQKITYSLGDEEVKQIAFSEDGKWLVTGTDSGQVVLRDAKSGEVKWTLKKNIPIRGVTFYTTAKQPYVFVRLHGSFEGYDTNTGKPHFSQIVVSEAQTLASMGNGHLIILPHNDGTIQSFKTVNGSMMAQFQHSAGGIAPQLGASRPDHNIIRVASLNVDGIVRIWDPFTGKEQFSLRGHDRKPLSAVAMSSDGSRVAAPDEKKRILIRPARAGTEWKPLLGANTLLEPKRIVWGVKGTSVVGIGRQQVRTPGTQNQRWYGNWRTWTVSNGKTETKDYVRLESNLLTSVLARSDGSFVLGTEEGVVVEWDMKTGKQGRLWKEHSHAVDVLVELKPGSDGAVLASATNNGEVNFRDANGKVVLRREGTGRRDHYGCAISCNGQIAVRNEGNVQLYGRDGRLITELVLGGPVVKRLAFDREGRRLAIATGEMFESSTVYIWDLSSPSPNVQWNHNTDLESMTWSPDGTRLVTGSSDLTVRVWEATTGQELLVLRGHRGSVIDLAFNEEGTRLASVGIGGEVLLWDGRP